jgi:hypothetical protein
MESGTKIQLKIKLVCVTYLHADSQLKGRGETRKPVSKGWSSGGIMTFYLKNKNKNKHLYLSILHTPAALLYRSFKLSCSVMILICHYGSFNKCLKLRSFTFGQ